jgi:hypothetical protein
MAFELEIVEIGLGQTLVGVVDANFVMPRRQPLTACRQRGEPEKSKTFRLVMVAAPPGA